MPRSEVDVELLVPFRDPPAGAKAAPLRSRLRRNGLWLAQQMAGRRGSIGCVSLEVTQRCNLDCTLCYLSEHSEAVRDLPLEEILRRVDLIHAHYGRGTDIQVSGGEPTLRKREELLAIVRRIRELGMRSSLFTNGIRANRALLAELAAAGMTDVAFHVDTTQRRAGYSSETQMNGLRDEYLGRVRGLPLSVFFNTTIHDGNLHEVPALAAFFAARAGAVRLVSFQLQADTGRGVLGARGATLSLEAVAERIREGVGTPLAFDTFLHGHSQCNRYAAALIVNGRAYDVFFDPRFAVDFMRRTARLRIDRGTPFASAKSLLHAALVSPRLAMRAVAWVARLVWRAKWDLVRAGGKAGKVSFFLHNFMDACHIDRARLDSCVFMAATRDGPMSMCAYNAQRDAYLLQPLETSRGPWDPLTGRRRSAHEEPAAIYPIKWLKGRSRATALRAREGARAPVASEESVP